MTYSPLKFKVASKAEEFEQIHRLNYRTFVEEIPQHPPNDEKLLVDRFHNENTYLLCLDGQKLAGMMAMRSSRPFSLDDKVAASSDKYRPATEAVFPPFRCSHGKAGVAAELPERLSAGAKYCPDLPHGAVSEDQCRQMVEAFVAAGVDCGRSDLRHMSFYQRGYSHDNS